MPDRITVPFTSFLWVLFSYLVFFNSERVCSGGVKVYMRGSYLQTRWLVIPHPSMLFFFFLVCEVPDWLHDQRCIIHPRWNWKIYGLYSFTPWSSVLIWKAVEQLKWLHYSFHFNNPYFFILYFHDVIIYTAANFTFAKARNSLLCTTLPVLCE